MPSNKKSGSFNKQREIEKKRRKRRKKRLITSILIMLITIIVLYLLNSPTFKIKNIEVMGNSQVDKQKIIEQSGIKIGNSIFSNIISIQFLLFQHLLLEILVLLLLFSVFHNCSRLEQPSVLKAKWQGY